MCWRYKDIAGRKKIFIPGGCSGIGKAAADHVNVGGVPYSSAKVGVNALTKAAALYLGPYKIRVNAIRLGLIATEKMAPTMAVEGYPDLVMEHTPLGRSGKPEDVANYALFLLSDYSSYMTGTLTAVDGGMELMGMLPVHKILRKNK